jgi:tetratricopeptide (TPR) repeat protein
VLSANVLDSAVYYNLAEIERQHGSPTDAAAYYNRALQLNPKLASIHRHLGEVYLAMDDTDRALSQFEAAVAEQPSDSDSLRLLGMLYVRKEQFARAIPYLNKVLQIGDKSKVTAEVQALLGAALFKTNQQALAQEHLRIALEQFPNNEEANRQLGDIYFDQGLYAEAKSNYERVLAHGQGTFEVYEHLGRIHSSRKEYSKAAHYFNSALAIKNSDAETLKNLGVAHFHQRQYKDAISCFNKALAADPNLAEPYFFLGDLARWQGKEAEAIRNYQMAIKIDTNYSDAHYRLGNLYLKKDQLQQAIIQFQAGLKNAPHDPKLSYALRQATQSQGKAEM